MSRSALPGVSWRRARLRQSGKRLVCTKAALTSTRRPVRYLAAGARWRGAAGAINRTAPVPRAKGAGRPIEEGERAKCSRRFSAVTYVTSSTRFAERLIAPPAGVLSKAAITRWMNSRARGSRGRGRAGAGLPSSKARRRHRSSSASKAPGKTVDSERKGAMWSICVVVKPMR